MKPSCTILQIVPRAPGSHDGVGDYARILATVLRREHGIDTIFAAASTFSPGVTSDGFTVLSPWPQVIREAKVLEPAGVILHYVNYGYDPRGIPLWLPRSVRELKGPAQLITIFHELYARGSLRQSAFWLRRLQKRLARILAGLSNAAVVSSEFYRSQLRVLSPSTPVVVQPVCSNLGEPELSRCDFESRDPHRWAICGGTQLIERSLHSFIRYCQKLPGSLAPRELVVLGGKSSSVRSSLTALKEVRSTYHPEVDPSAASDLLSSCAFGWIDYFVHSDIPLGAILKSSAFAALCAHGVVPVTPQSGDPISHRADALPGPYFINHSGQHLPVESECAEIAFAVYSWYRRNAAAKHLAAAVESALFSA